MSVAGAVACLLLAFMLLAGAAMFAEIGRIAEEAYGMRPPTPKGEAARERACK